MERRNRACNGGSIPARAGEPRTEAIELRHYRSIPARAGEPTCRRALSLTTTVYPRACGGAPLTSDKAESARGLSPRVRGSRSSSHRPPTCLRSIPARAGEPRRRVLRVGIERVYPRACGGARRVWVALRTRQGLSPRVRGSRGATYRHQWNDGSIPARAGEPGADCPCHADYEVYPRACGGAWGIGAHI